MKVTSHITDPNTQVETQTKDQTYLASETLGQIFAMADKTEDIEHHEIRTLTQLVLKIKPEEVDEVLQLKLAEIMGKVKAQYA